MELERALQIVRAAGYRVSKPREKAVESVRTRTLNALGKPYSASYDPGYRMKYRRNVIAELSKGTRGINNLVSDEDCAARIAHWRATGKWGNATNAAYWRA